MLAQQAAAIDDLSGGRLILGLGLGYSEFEHNMWGYPLGSKPERIRRFEERVEVITRLFRSDETFSYEGQTIQLHDARLMPRPMREGGPSILIGGNGVRKTLPMVARYADVWNVMHISPELYRERSRMLDELLRQVGRQPGEVKRTMLVMVFCGQDEAELRNRVGFISRNWMPELAGLSFDRTMASVGEMFSPFLNRLRAYFSPLIGTPEQVIDQMRAYEAAGVEELIIQWFDLEDIEGLQRYAEYLLPRLQS